MSVKSNDYFIFNGVKSSDMGISVLSLPPITPSQPIYTKNTIPGKDGYCLVNENREEGDILPVECLLKGKNLTQIGAWLRGEGTVEFSHYPGHFFRCFISNKIPIADVVRNEIYSFPVYFDCQPYAYLNEGKELINLTPYINSNTKTLTLNFTNGDESIENKVIKKRGNANNCPTLYLKTSSNSSGFSNIFIKPAAQLETTVIQIQSTGDYIIVDVENKLVMKQDETGFIKYASSWPEVNLSTLSVMKISNIVECKIQWNWRDF